MKTKRLSNNLVGTAGEYFVCAELCKMGFLALLTPKNNPLFDIVATSEDGSRSVAIQVKTRSIQNNQDWKFGADMANGNDRDGLFVVLVNLEALGPPVFFVYQYGVLAERVARVYDEYIEKPKKDGAPRKAVTFRWFDEISFCEDDHFRKNNWDPIVKALQSV